MQLFPILLVAIVLAADAGVDLQPEWLELGPGETVLAVWLPVAIIVCGTWGLLTYFRLRLGRGGSPALLMIAERLVAGSRWLLLLHHAAAIFLFGWLGIVREGIGDVVLVDELIALLPAIVGVIGLWWAYYPVEIRIREAMLIRRLDLGKPVHPPPSRARYVFEQVRFGLLLLLVPLLLIIAMAESIGFAAERLVDPEIAWRIASVSILISAAFVFLFAPLIARLLLNVERMPDGEVREELLDVCRRHIVRVRDVLLWHTSGSMINAAVMGLIAPLRYVLITDGLLESMRPDQVRAVMAHEVGHVRRRHMPWMVLTLIAIMVGSIVVIELVLLGGLAVGLSVPRDGQQWVIAFMGAGQLLFVLLMFGWVSRRFERQADSFAVQHLSGLGMSGAQAANPSGTITPEAVAAMNGALETIARLNAVDPNRPSWRHGSIAWRQSYLHSLIGSPLERVPVDPVIRRIKGATAIVLLLAACTWGVLELFGPDWREQNEPVLPSSELLYVEQGDHALSGRM